MGLFDFLNRGKKVNGNVNTEAKEFAQGRDENKPIITILDGGKRVQIEFYDPDMEFGQFYDTTRLIVDREGRPMGNSVVNDCLISWFGRDDAHMIGDDPREDYEQILATLDVDRMISDREYLDFAMKHLLNQKRVQGYLERGKSLDKQEHPCGNYVGYIGQTPEGKLEKRFNLTVGIASHNSPYMVGVRAEIKAEREKRIRAQIQDAQAQLKVAQVELDKLQ